VKAPKYFLKYSLLPDKEGEIVARISEHETKEQNWSLGDINVHQFQRLVLRHR
jgi:hypothetical protein